MASLHCPTVMFRTNTFSISPPRHDSNEQQKEDIHHFINEGVDLLVVAPNEAAPITPVVEEAYNRGIPVIVVDRKILSDKYTAYVGADNYEIGKAIGNYIGVMLTIGLASFPLIVL